MRLFHRSALMLLASLSFAASGATLKGPSDARKLADNVMAKVAAGDTEGGLRLTKPYVIIPDAEFEAMLGQLKLQAPLMASRFGATVSSEFIREDTVGDSLVRLTYIQRFERHPMRWVFYFYRGKDGWVLNTFRTDDAIQLLFP